MHKKSPKSLRKKAHKLGLHVTVKHNGKRVPKDRKVLEKQVKRKSKRKSKRRKSKQRKRKRKSKRRKSKRSNYRFNCDCFIAECKKCNNWNHDTVPQCYTCATKAAQLGENAQNQKMKIKYANIGQKAYKFYKDLKPQYEMKQKINALRKST